MRKSVKRLGLEVLKYSNYEVLNTVPEYIRCELLMKESEYGPEKSVRDIKIIYPESSFA